MNWLSICIVAVLLALGNSASVENKKIGNDEDRKWMKGGKCRFKWRPERLSGECPGLQPHSAFEEIKHIQVVNNSVICKSLCCNLEDKCTTWQYEISEKKCMLGGAVVTVNETAPAGMTVLGKCNPAVVAWSGRRVETRKSNNTCTWGARLPNQCTGLGHERLSKNGTRMSSRHCELACCESKQCDLWQESPKHGCYFGLKSTAKCDEGFKRKVYDGGRKCIPGLCGGMENIILNRTIPTAPVHLRTNKDANSMLLNDKQSNTLVGSAMSAFKSTFGNVGAMAEINQEKRDAMTRTRVPRPGANTGAGAAPAAAASGDAKPAPFGGHKGGEAAAERQKQFDLANPGVTKNRPMKGKPKAAPAASA